MSSSSSSSSKTKNVIKNLSGTLFYQLCTILTNIIVLNLFLVRYGSEINGLVSTLNQILGYVALLEAGLGVTAIQALYRPIASNDYHQINRILRSATNYYNKTAAIYVMCVVMAGVILMNVLNTDIPKLNIFLMLIILAIPTILDYLFQGKMRILLTADQDVFTLNILNSITVIITGITRVGLINNNASYVSVQGVFIVFTIVKIIFLYQYYKNKYTWVELNVRPNDKALGQKNANLIHQIAGLVVNGTDAIVISIFLGLKNASIYSVYAIVFSALSTFMWQFSNAATPSFGHYMIENDENNLKKIFLEFSNGFYIIVFSVYTVAYLMIVPFIKLYTQSITDTNYEIKYLPILFVAIGIASSIRIPSNNMINAAGFFENTKMRAVIEAVINVLLSVIGVQFIGIHGVLIGTICSFLYRTVDIILFTNKYIVKNVISDQIMMLLVDSVVAFVFIWGVGKIDILKVKNWLSAVIFTICLFIMILLFQTLANYILQKKHLVPNIQRIKNLVNKL